ncbi:hypothetical protein MPSEU_000189100 [Mayamaea pseudoterrestris]|nr:hypothetical protein MPSEU_000189100 [Mayamaea pseudoterrestris]
MVVRSGFQVDLVDAETKKPFKEHEKDGKVYVEVEPDTDYFIAIRRITQEGFPKILSLYSVDGKKLDYHQPHDEIDAETFYQGIWSRIDGKDQIKALRFAKPSPAEAGKGYEGNTGFVEIKLYEAIFEGVEPVIDHISSVELHPSVDAARASSKKKFLLTKAGTSTIFDDTKSDTMSWYSKGKEFDRISFNYCSALGLILAGVLPKPDLWTWQRMKHPAPSGQLTAPFKKMRHKDKVIEVVDLTDEDALPIFTW